MNATIRQTDQNHPRLLRMKEAVSRTGKYRSGIEVSIYVSRFPQPIQRGPRPPAFPEPETNPWIEQLAAKRKETVD